jgi:hypothetical protein
MFKHLVKTKRKGTFATEREAWNNVKGEYAIIEPIDTETNPKNEATIIPETEIPEAALETEMPAALQVQATPRAYPHWENPATKPQQATPTHLKPKFEFKHRANVVTTMPGQILNTEVRFDMYSNPFIVPEPNTGFVQYLNPTQANEEPK